MAPDRTKMSVQHEDFLAELTGGYRSANSGAGWKDKADGRASRLRTEVAFAFDGKSTCGQGISVTREILGKLREEAGGERPMVGLRWYTDESLTRVDEDWVAIPAEDMRELLERSAELENLKAAVTEMKTAGAAPQGPGGGGGTFFPSGQGSSAADGSGSGGGGGAVQPAPYVAQARVQSVELPWGMPGPHAWPCAVYEVWDTPEGRVLRGVAIGPDGSISPLGFSQVRIERDIGNADRLIVDERLVRSGELRINGVLRCRVGMGSILGT